MNPEISIILCVYNGEKTISQAIESIVKQTFKDWQLLIVNDGSTDATAEICTGFLADSRITLIYQDNKGLGAARNVGISATQCKWVCFIDADDLWVPRKLEILVQYTVKFPQADWLYHSVFEKYKNGLMRQRNFWEVKSIADLVEKGNPFVPSAVAIKHAVLQESNLFESARNLVDDLGLWLALLSDGIENRAIPKPLTIYSVGGGISSQIDVIQQKIQNTLEVSQQKGLISEAQKQMMLQRNVYETARYYHKLGEFEAAQDYYQNLKKRNSKTKILALMNKWKIVI